MFLRKIGTRGGVLFAGCFATAAAVFAFSAAVYTPPPRAVGAAEPDTPTEVEVAPVRGSVLVDWRNVRVVPQEPWGLVIERRRAARRTPAPAVELSPASRPTGGARTPDRPSREQVRGTLATIRRGVQRCFDIGMVPGLVTMNLTVVGQTGRVVRARVSGPPNTAGCIRALARNLEFPRFAHRRITIRHSYNLR